MTDDWDKKNLEIRELEAQVKMLNEKLGYYEAKIRRLECEVRVEKSNVEMLWKLVPEELIGGLELNG